MRTAFFFGAGASAAIEGIPSQAGLLREYFSKTYHERRSPVESNVRSLFRDTFGIDVYCKTDEPKELPTFEEVLGLIDLAKDCDANIGTQGPRTAATAPLVEQLAKTNCISPMRLYFILLLAKAIHPNAVVYPAVFDGDTAYHKLLKYLNERGELSDTVFMTTNYDIFFDAALYKMDCAPRYGPRFSYDAPATQLLVDAPTRLKESLGQKTEIDFFKLHGSVNWLHCNECGQTRYWLFRPLVLELLKVKSKGPFCSSCRTLGAPVIVPPTVFKSPDLAPAPLQGIWQEAEKKLTAVDRIVFVGYSFPDADMHVKQMLKRVQVNRAMNQEYLVLTKTQKCEEKSRYKRFLGDRVDYRVGEFGKFVKNPSEWLD